MEIRDICMLYVGIYIYSTSDLTFVARVQNDITWAEFSANYLFSIG